MTIIHPPLEYTAENEFGGKSKIVQLRPSERSLGWCPFYVPSLGPTCVEVRLHTTQPIFRVTVWGGDDTGFERSFNLYDDAVQMFDWLTTDTIRIRRMVQIGFVNG